jgi:hypothetical protein
MTADSEKGDFKTLGYATVSGAAVRGLIHTLQIYYSKGAVATSGSAMGAMYNTQNPSQIPTISRIPMSLTRR